MGVVFMGIYVLRHFKEEMTRATDMQLQVISNIMFRYTTKKINFLSFCVKNQSIGSEQQLFK